MTEIFRPTDPAQAVALLQADKTAALISGGTALMQELRAGRRTCSAWISTDALGLDRMEAREDGLYLGAAATMTQIEGSPLLWETPYTLLPEALRHTASWQIRNVATLGGCIGAGIPGADPVCALLALDAELLWQDAAGAHRAPLVQFYGNAPEKLPRESVITHIFLPNRPAAQTIFRKAAVRKAFSWPLVNFAAVVSRNADGSLGSVRIAAGGMARSTMLLKKTAEAMQTLDFAAVTDAYAAEIAPADSLQGSADYKRLVCKNYLLELFEALTGKENPAWN